MALLIVGLIGLFLICSLFYGIYSGVGAIVQGASRSAKPRQPPESACLAPMNAVPASARSQIDELKTLFELHQSGALTRQEFEWMKQHLIPRPPPQKA